MRRTSAFVSAVPTACQESPTRSSPVPSIARAALLLPRNVGIAILTAYRTVVSPLYGDVCRYYPSCSHYTLQAFQLHGVLRGTWLGARRIARCHPWADGGIDDVPAPKVQRYALNRFGFVVANGHGKGFSHS